jgi:hypothetical protein
LATRPPIAFFAFNRPGHAAAALEALSRCEGAAESALTVFVDGPRTAQEKSLCDEVAAIAHGARGFASLRVQRAEVNQGLFHAITGGVSALLEDAGSVVVVEDDLVVEPDFLDYMAWYLDAYRDEPAVGCIHGYALPIEGLPEYFFLRGGDCWGWATWRERWQLFRADAPALLRELHRRGLLQEFMESHGASSLELLCERAQGRTQSWAILWHASLFLAGRMTLHPGRSFVENIGNDGSGTHSAATQRFRAAPRAAGTRQFQRVPVHADAGAAALTSAFMDGRARPSLLGRWLLSLRRARALSRASRLARACA